MPPSSGAYRLQRWKDPRSGLCPAAVLPEEGNLHTLQGPRLSHGCHNYHPCQMLRPSRWRFNHCYNLTTHRHKVPTYSQESCASKEDGGPGAQALCLTSANTPPPTLGANMKHRVYLMLFLSWGSARHKPGWEADYFFSFGD